jgi:PPOX class probable F420-dependent enzyme
VTPLPDEIRALLAGRNLAHLATVMPDGSPHSVPIWIGVDDDDRLVMFTQTTTRKSRNIERDPRVAISVEDRENPYLQADLRGRVVGRIDAPASHEVSDRLSQKYLGKPFPWHQPTMVAYVIEVDRTHMVELPFTA